MTFAAFFLPLSNFRTKILFLNRSNYEEYPDIFSSKYEPFEPQFRRRRNITGLYECANINPRGPTKSGIFNGVR